MMSIFEFLVKSGKKTDGQKKAKTLSHEDYLEILAQYEQTYCMVKDILDEATSNADVEKDNDRFHYAPLSSLDEEYLNLFSNPPMDKPARRGKSAYLRDAYHERIRKIVNALNIEGVNISSYVDMVLTDHLMRYETQIDRLLQNCSHDKPKRQRQWQPS